MTSLIGENADQLRAIARPRRVRRLAAFGSATTDEFDAAGVTSTWLSKSVSGTHVPDLAVPERTVIMQRPPMCPATMEVDHALQLRNATA